MELDLELELENFNKKVESIRGLPNYVEPIAFGLCRNLLANDGRVLESKFIHTNHKENYGSAAILTLIGEAMSASADGYKLHDTENESVYKVDKDFLDKALNEFIAFKDEVTGDKHINIQALLAMREATETYEDMDDNTKTAYGAPEYRFVVVYNDKPVETVESTYLKLTLLSECKVGVRELNLDGAFGVLTNCAWLSNGLPIALDELRAVKMRLIANGEYPSITHIDKFPYMLQHVLPADNTRILDTSKVRMGAHLANGTTVMPGASYVNFNAGTEGPVMVEGRVSSSVKVGSGSDIGGGASILGVLSGGNNNPISIGKKCLLGANSVTGISLGDNCIVDAGATILAGTYVSILGSDWHLIHEANEGVEIECRYKEHTDEMTESSTTYYVKGSSLSGLSGIHYREDSTTGLTVAFLSERVVKLNSDLH